MKLDKKFFTTVLLDADGTLPDFNEAARRGVRAVIKAYGMEPTRTPEQRYHEINKNTLILRITKIRHVPAAKAIS